jgi:hypothetical protein
VQRVVLEGKLVIRESSGALAQRRAAAHGNPRLAAHGD